jgi:hypothetical protein
MIFSKSVAIGICNTSFILFIPHPLYFPIFYFPISLTSLRSQGYLYIYKVQQKRKCKTIFYFSLPEKKHYQYLEGYHDQLNLNHDQLLLLK